MNGSNRVLRRPRRESPLIRRGAAVFIAAAALAVLAAACGGSAGSHAAQLGSTMVRPAASASSGSATAAPANAVSFARCMRAHRVPNWPDPNSRGVFDKSKLSSQRLGASNVTVRVAQSACNHLLLSGGSGPNAAQLQQIKAQGLSFSRCIRAHGVPNFPDPGSDGRIPDPASVGIDQGGPKFQAANQACATYRPPYMPSNSAYDAWARAHPSGS